MSFSKVLITFYVVISVILMSLGLYLTTYTPLVGEGGGLSPILAIGMFVLGFVLGLLSVKDSID